ncbi:class I SAM-dependent methyltransferase [uncultured Maribacter sp.]|uniref:O-methyltransferase n=1 Tax=uncultured Maribacter sp. TaxID=431308 RepID=UPI0026086BA2|nr:class I SAM-dependent methyltransferase [uncultured Maribacter sp.]
MHIIQEKNINQVLIELFKDAKNDRIRMMKSFAKNPFRTMQPIDFKEVYLSISKNQGEELVSLIKKNNLKNIVEFGTSFGISTLFLAEGAIQTQGNIITTELIESKAEKAKENFKKAGVDNLIEVRQGNALETLKNHNKPIDLLLLDGWKDLYLPLFQMLETNFHENTIIYVDNADMPDSQDFLKAIRKKNNFQLQSKFDGKVVFIYTKKEKI